MNLNGGGFALFALLALFARVKAMTSSQILRYQFRLIRVGVRSQNSGVRKDEEEFNS